MRCVFSWWKPAPLDVPTLEEWVDWELTVFKAQQGCSHLARHKHSHINSCIRTQILIQTHIQYTDAERHWPTVQKKQNSEEKERKREWDQDQCWLPKKTKNKKTLQTELTDRERRIILRSLAGLKASPDPRRAHLRWWRTWPGYTSYGDEGNAGPVYLWSQQRSWRSAGPSNAKVQQKDKNG